MCGRPGSRLGNNAEPSPRKAPCSPRHGASASLTDGCQDEKLPGNEIEIPVASAPRCAAPLRNKGMTDSLAAVLQLNRETRNSAALEARKEAWAEAYEDTPHGQPVELSVDSLGS